jgi:hypothetical protein
MTSDNVEWLAGSEQADGTPVQAPSRMEEVAALTTEIAQLRVELNGVVSLVVGAIQKTPLGLFDAVSGVRVLVAELAAARALLREAVTAMLAHDDACRWSTERPFMPPDWYERARAAGGET